MNTFIWVVGGIISALIISLIFIQVLSNMTIEKHRQDSIMSFNGVVSNINKFCGMNIDQSSEHSITFSSLVSDIFAFDEDNITEKNNRTVGNQICMNLSNEIYCKKLDCQIELDKISTMKTISGLIDRILKKVNYIEYPLNFIKTKCGVSVLLKDSEAICECNTENVSVPIHCEYNGEQPILSLKDKVIVLTDTYNWINAGEEIETLLDNTANYLGGSEILLVFEEDLTNPYEINKSNILTNLQMQGYNIDIIRHNSGITNFGDYDQIWLITPGFCDEELRNCTNYEKWREDEINNIIEFVKEGNGLLLVTDSGMRSISYERIGLRVINKILKGVGYPFEQIQSCVCGCGEGKLLETTIENHELTENLSGFNVSEVAVLKCRYEY